MLDEGEYLCYYNGVVRKAEYPLSPKHFCVTWR